MHDITITIDEAQRQMILLALAKLSIERPGWHWTLGELAAVYSTAPQLEDGRAMFESFRKLHAADLRQAIISVHPECEEGCPVHVRYVDDRGNTWDHGYAEVGDLDLRREVEEWLMPSEGPLTPIQDRTFITWRPKPPE